MDHAATGRAWAVATPHTLATDAAAVAFERGGNAIDAALAAATTLAVVYPHMCGVGGDLFALVHHPAGDVVAINASGRAPAAADVRRGGGRRGRLDARTRPAQRHRARRRERLGRAASSGRSPPLARRVHARDRARARRVLDALLPRRHPGGGTRPLRRRPGTGIHLLRRGPGAEAPARSGPPAGAGHHPAVDRRPGSLHVVRRAGRRSLRRRARGPRCPHHVGRPGGPHRRPRLTAPRAVPRPRRPGAPPQLPGLRPARDPGRDRAAAAWIPTHRGPMRAWWPTCSEQRLEIAIVISPTPTTCASTRPPCWTKATSLRSTTRFAPGSPGRPRTVARGRATRSPWSPPTSKAVASR